MSIGEPAAIAVFLGPSLPRDAASALLPAQYFAPAQFGDVYRLLGSGVRAVVLLDGVFHGRAPVWQRELLCAMQNGIRVYGAASMGALRAAELHAHGMVGLGSVYAWYRSGEIDGDDEVALLHADAERRYRPLTWPLVNVRATLRAAVASGLANPEQATAITAHLKALPFWARTAEALADALSCHVSDALGRARLRAFFDDAAIDVKAQDAALALSEVARREQAHAGSAATRVSSPVAGPSHYDRFRLLKRAFPRAGGGPIAGAALVEWVLADPTRRRLLRWALGARFFLTKWAQEKGIALPTAQNDATAVSPSPLEPHLRHSALTTLEHETLTNQEALVAWLLAQQPESFGLPSILQEPALLAEIPDLALDALRPLAGRAAIARTLPYVAAWCELTGASLPEAGLAKWTERLAGSLATLGDRGQAAASLPFLTAVWAIDQGPAHFGYATWSLAAELLAWLQCQGAVAAVAAHAAESGT